MKKKAIIIVVGMLLIFPFVANAEKIGFSQNLGDSVPVWSNGNKWIYDIYYEGDFGSAMSFSWDFDNLEFLVTDVSSSTYSVEISGGVTGEINLFGMQVISGQLKDTTIAGTCAVSKSNIGMQSVDANLNGKIAIAGIPVKTFTMDVDLAINPAYNAVKFPINTGDQWIVQYSGLQGMIDISLLNDPININDVKGGFNVDCEGMETISVGAGSFNSYKMTTDGDIQEMYYSAEAGNIVSAYGDVSKVIDIELVSTNYGAEPGAPNRPSRPSGPSSGTSGNTYTYSTSTTDNEGDDVYYWFDWGDGTNSGWKGPFSSGETCDTTKSWGRRGTFAVKVKAKDVDGHESQWSESLSVSMPKIKLFTIQQGNFEAQIGFRGEERPFATLDGQYQSRWRFVTFSGTASTDDAQGRFQGMFRGNFIIIQMPVREKTVTVFARVSFDQRNFEGNWRARGYRVGGWITGSLSS